MRAFGGIVATLLLCACSTDAAPVNPVVGSAQRVEVQSEIVLAPSRPTPAFVPAERGACPREYRPVDGSCVHHAYVVADDATLSRALAAYKRGAVPPMLGPAEPKAPAPPAAKGPLDPGALTRPSGDAGAGRERRLAELDAMIAVAKEKLRERDERSKARRVDGPPRRAAPAAVATETPVPTGGPSAPAAGADPTQARLSELSQLASQLPPEQLQAITAELGKAGMDIRELQQLLSSVRTGETPR